MLKNVKVLGNCYCFYLKFSLEAFVLTLQAFVVVLKGVKEVAKEK